MATPTIRSPQSSRCISLISYLRGAARVGLMGTLEVAIGPQRCAALGRTTRTKAHGMCMYRRAANRRLLCAREALRSSDTNSGCHSTGTIRPDAGSYGVTTFPEVDDESRTSPRFLPLLQTSKSSVAGCTGSSARQSSRERRSWVEHWAGFTMEFSRH
jgi:hypothetical protein